MAKKKKKTEEQQRLEQISQQKTKQSTTNIASSLATAIGNVAKDIAPVKQTVQKTTKKQTAKDIAPVKTQTTTNTTNKIELPSSKKPTTNIINTTTNKPQLINPLQANQKSVARQILSPQEIKSPENIQKQQESIRIGQQKEKGGNTSLEGTTLNSLKLFGQGMMKAEEGAFIDAPVGLASTVVNAGKKLGYGVTKGASIVTGGILGLFDKNLANEQYAIGDQISKEILGTGDTIENKLNSFIEKDLSANALDYYGWNKKLSNGKTVEEQLGSDSAIKKENIAGQVIEGLGGMAPSILMGGVLGLSSTPQTMQDVEKLQKLQQVVSYSSLGARSYGNGYEEAIREGATTEQASAYGLSNAAVEIGTEWLSGGIPGVKGTAGAGLDGAFEKYVLKEGIEETSKSLSKAIVKSLYKTTMEGVEEMISETLSPFIKQFTYQYDETKGFKGNLQEAANKVSFEDIVKAGIVGSLTAIALGDVDIKDMKAGYQNSQAINQVINSEIANAEQQIGRELTTNEKKDIKAAVNEEVDNIRQFGEETATHINEVRKNNVSTEGMTLEESYVAYNKNDKSVKQIRNIQQAINNRGINARYDATMFKNNNQNALWTTQDGKQTVIFNPNANTEKIIQNIATHEMAHDIFNQKSQTGTSLFNDVLEYAKTDKNYQQMRSDLEQTYSEYYDKNSQDFNAKIDEEIVADYLGDNLGTQEYINRLIGEKPSLARRIYNWVKDKLSNEKTSEQKAYWKSVADKFEKAYNEQKTNQTSNNTSYSIGKHYGDLGKGNDTYYGHMYDSRRSTGHFGTGTYFVGENYQPSEYSSYANRPVNKVEFDDYNNLFKPTSSDEGFDLHDSLKEVNYNNTPISEELYNKLLPYYEASFKSYNDVLDQDYNNDYKNVRKHRRN